MGKAAHGGVGVHPQDAGGGKDLFQPLFGPLGAQPGIVHIGAAAGGAGFRLGDAVAAVVANQPPVGGVVGHGDIAVGAAGFGAALHTLYLGAVTPAVEQQHRLFAGLQVLVKLVQQGLAEAVPGAGVLLHVDDVDIGQLGGAIALAQGHQQPVAFLAR